MAKFLQRLFGRSRDAPKPPAADQIPAEPPAVKVPVAVQAAPRRAEPEVPSEPPVPSEPKVAREPAIHG